MQLRFSASAVEALVRYPVQRQRAPGIDERIFRELLKVITNAARTNPSRLRNVSFR